MHRSERAPVCPMVKLLYHGMNGMNMVAIKIHHACNSLGPCFSVELMLACRERNNRTHNHADDGISTMLVVYY